MNRITSGGTLGLFWGRDQRQCFPLTLEYGHLQNHTHFFFFHFHFGKLLALSDLISLLLWGTGHVIG